MGDLLFQIVDAGMKINHVSYIRLNVIVASSLNEGELIVISILYLGICSRRESREQEMLIGGLCVGLKEGCFARNCRMHRVVRWR